MSTIVTLDALRSKLAARQNAGRPDNGRFDAPKLEAVIGDLELSIDPRVFSTGGLGWYGRQKATFHGLGCTVQITVTVDGSKPQVNSMPVTVKVPA